MQLRFDEAKATQIACMFLRLRGGRMHYIKLIKLLYLLDREALDRWGIPVTTDHFASMEHGPIVGRIFNLITDDKPTPVWGRYISAPLGDHEVELRKNSNPMSTDRLSSAEEELVREIFKEFGHRDRWDLIENHMHKLPEWRDPQGSSFPIHIRQILTALGHSEDDIRATLRELRTETVAQQILSPAI
jgi:uncharacterized phage-associated protein